MLGPALWRGPSGEELKWSLLLWLKSSLQELQHWLDSLMTTSRETEPEAPRSATAGIWTHRNCELINVCCFKLLLLGIIFYNVLK